jgi:hypothetical protein
MRTKLAFISVCILFCISYSCSGKSTEQTKEIETQDRSIYLEKDAGSGKWIYFISEQLVPDSVWRERLGKALVTIYLGEGQWSEGENTFKEAGPIGMRVLIVASREVENDNGTAALVLRELGKEGCIAMIDYLKTRMNNNEGLDLYFIKELGDSGYKDAIGVLSSAIHYSKSLPEEIVAAAIALAKFGDYQGLDILGKMRDEKTDPSWQELFDHGIKTIEQLKIEQKR